MNEKTQLKQKLFLLCIWGIMGLLLYQQFQKIYIYFDDYAYYSLSYAESYKATKDFTLPQLVTFMKAHYMDANGRLLYFFVWLLLYWLGGLSLVQLSASVIMLAVIFLLWKMASIKLDGRHKIFSAFFICALYWLLDITFLSQGIYWFTAFFLYVTPIGILIGAAWLYFFTENTTAHKALILLLLFMAGWAQEQQSAATLAFSLFLVIYSVGIKKEKLKNAIIYLFPAILSLLIVVMSPGIQKRITTADNGLRLVDKLLMDASKATYLLETASSWRIDLFIFLSLLIISVYNFKRTINKPLKCFDILQILLYIYLIYLYALKRTDVEFFVASQNTLPVVIVGATVILSLTIQIVRFELLLDNRIMLTVFLSAMSSIAVLLFIPQLPNRLLTFFILTMFGICTQAICCLLTPPNAVTTLVTVILVVLALKNGTTIYHGYAENYEVLRENNRTIESVAKNYNAEDAAPEIELKKLPYPQYCCVSPDDENYRPVQNVFINNYYNLPANTSYIYK